MKAYTDLEQSRKLAEILPIESADMCYLSKDSRGIEFFEEPVVNDGTREDDDIPCWSLAALIEIIRKPTAFDLLIDGRGCRCHCRDKQEGKFYGTDDYCDNAIDACVEIIIKLYEQKIL